jgi:uncharacterized membrane protein
MVKGYRLIARLVRSPADNPESVQKRVPNTKFSRQATSKLTRSNLAYRRTVGNRFNRLITRRMAKSFFLQKVINSESLNLGGKASNSTHSQKVKKRALMVRNNILKRIANRSTNLRSLAKRFRYRRLKHFLDKLIKFSRTGRKSAITKRKHLKNLSVREQIRYKLQNAKFTPREAREALDVLRITSKYEKSRFGPLILKETLAMKKQVDIKRRALIKKKRQAKFKSRGMNLKGSQTATNQSNSAADQANDNTDKPNRGKSNTQRVGEKDKVHANVRKFKTYNEERFQMANRDQDKNYKTAPDPKTLIKRNDQFRSSRVTDLRSDKTPSMFSFKKPGNQDTQGTATQTSYKSERSSSNTQNYNYAGNNSQVEFKLNTGKNYSGKSNNRGDNYSSQGTPRNNFNQSRQGSQENKSNFKSNNNSNNYRRQQSPGSQNRKEDNGRPYRK